MKTLITMLLFLSIVGCQSTSKTIEPLFTSDVVEIKESELSNYWVLPPTKIKMTGRLPSWAPNDKSQWIVLTVIDSNGDIVESTLVKSAPENAMTQSRVDKMPKPKYKPATSNPDRKPVKFYSLGAVVPISEVKATMSANKE